MSKTEQTTENGRHKITIEEVPVILALLHESKLLRVTESVSLSTEY